MPSATSGTFSFKYTYPDADGNMVSSGLKTVPIPFDIPITGQIPVPAGTPSGTEIDIPFTGIVSAATFVYVQNLTGQELNAAWEGNWAPHLGAGAAMFYACPNPPESGGITSLRFMLTQDQVARGRIAYVVLGS
jgi:hypothetical protein